MAVVPLKQTVYVHKPEIVDDWGIVTPQEPISMRCRADEVTEVVTSNTGDEVVSGVQFLFDKLPNIAYDDVIEYTNELDVTIKRNPVRIEPIRGVNGKAMLTAVYL